MSNSIIQMKEVNKWCGDFQVLKDINLEVKEKQKIVVWGPSCLWKSTLIRCINRLEEDQKGQIIQMVPDLYVAWHAGKSFWKKDKNLNKSSIGIEI